MSNENSLILPWYWTPVEDVMSKLEKLDKLENKSGRVRKVGRYSLDGKLLEVFDKVNDAKRKWGSSAVGCLRGSFKTSKGFIFKYII